MKLLAPAKINLTLHITGKRADGYHLLDSLVVFLDFGDMITIAPAKTNELRVSGAFAGSVSETHNLMLDALQLIQRQHSGVPPMMMTLEKNVPVGAGLGGGSADAAAVLRGVNQLCRLGLSLEALQQMALPLGSDLPACLRARPLWMSGVGETLEDARIGFSGCILLAYPRIALATPEVYRAFSGNIKPPVSRKQCADEASLLSYLRSARNDLTEPAIALCPQVALLLDALRQAGRPLMARMTGSGAACFALYQDLESGSYALQQLQHQFTDYWFQLTRMLDYGEA